MKMMVRRSLPLLGLVVVMLGMAHLGWAQTTTGNSSGQVSEVLSFNLYCQVISLLEGYIGLLLGLIMLVAGFWTLIKGGSVPVALSMILMGGLVTALPSLIISTLKGLDLLLQDTHLTSTALTPPDCGTSMVLVGNGSMQLPNISMPPPVTADQFSNIGQ